MKLFIRNLIVFLIGFISIIVLPVLLVSKYDNLDKWTSENHNIIRLQTMSSYDSLDVLFVGNSYCYSSINTNYLDSLNILSFNLGIATAGVQFYDLVINDYYDNISLAPKMVFLLITPMTFSSESDNFNAYPIHRYLENEKSNLEVAFKFNRLGKVISMYKKSFKKGLVNILTNKKKFQEKSRLNYKGFFPSNEVFTPENIPSYEHLYLPLKKDIFNKSKLKYLLDVAKIIKQRGSEVVFFELPTNQLDNYFNTQFLSEYKDGINYINKSFEFISLDPALFCENDYRNIDHMNSSGANIATEELIRILNEENTLTHNTLHK
ncbi:MAG: hypothetical protein JXB49_13095 [Bacteroidales bacterium]|nr:hypothetical protein [Bacteroidales bacterium]